MPMFGFSSYDEYCEASVIAGKMNKITVPTFCLSANDDQVTPSYTNPYKEVQRLGSNVILATTDYGAHVSHFNGFIIPGQWYQHPFIEFFNFLELKKMKTE